MQTAVALTITIICVASAAFFKAVADTLSHHFDTSVFKWRKREWWDPNVSWQHVGFLPLTKYRADAWHLANSFQIVCWCAAVAVCPPLPWWAVIITAGFLFVFVFNLFYNKILRS